MQKKSFFILLFSICAVFAYSQTTVSLDQAVENGARYLNSRFSKGTRAALIALRSENPDLGEFVLRKISGVMVNNGWFTMVERNQSTLDALSREMDYQMSGYVSEETELSIGKQLGVEVIISGAFTRSGQNWRLELQALRVESAQIGGQWSGENIRPDPAWVSLVSSQSATVYFAGDEVSARDRQTITDGLRNAMQTWKTALELDLQSAIQTGNNFTITIHQNKLPTGLIQAEVTIAFLRNGRVILNSAPYHITEMNDTQLSRRIAEHIRGDQAFFTKVNEALR